MRISRCSKLLSPLDSTLTLYVPAGRSGNLNSPRLSVKTRQVDPGWDSRAKLTDAAGIGVNDSSKTVPLSEPAGTQRVPQAVRTLAQNSFATTRERSTVRLIIPI